MGCKRTKVDCQRLTLWSSNPCGWKYDIPGIGYRMGAMILAEVGDFSRFDSPDKPGMSPSTYQSGQFKNCYPHMEKRGPGICATPSTTLPSTFAIGTPPLPPILPRSGLRASITTLPYPTPLRSWCGLSSLWRNPNSLIVR